MRQYCGIVMCIVDWTSMIVCVLLLTIVRVVLSYLSCCNQWELVEQSYSIYASQVMHCACHYRVEL